MGFELAKRMFVGRGALSLSDGTIPLASGGVVAPPEKGQLVQHSAQGDDYVGPSAITLPGQSPFAMSTVKDWLAHKKADFLFAKRTYRMRTAFDTLSKGGGGICVGWLLLRLVSSNPVWGAVLGGCIGLGWAVKTALEHGKGKVEVVLDGQSRKAPWYGQPFNFDPREEEVVAELIANRINVEHMPLPSKEALQLTPVRSMAGYETHLGNLKSLATQRRLVADLGQRTLSGEPAVQLVTAKNAYDLLAADKPVYIVSGSRAVDRQREYRMIADNTDGTDKMERSFRWVERTFSYDLNRIDAPKDLSEASKEGAGVPEGMMGVLRDSGTYAEVIGQANRHFRAKRPREGEFKRHSSRTRHSQDPALVLAYGETTPQ